MSKDIWNDFDEKTEELFRFTNGKQVVLWGYGYSGWFIEHLFQRKNRSIEYIVDDGDLSCKLKLYCSFILKDMDKDTTAVILTFKHDENAEKLLEEAGYKRNEHYIYARDLFYGENDKRMCSYHNWLEEHYKMDLVKCVPVEELELSSADAILYSPGIDYALPAVLDNFSFTENDSVFGFGCGKGGALLLFSIYGVKKLGGVEFDTNLYETLEQNFNMVGMDTNGIIHGDATQAKEKLDDYNYFYMYNPFEGDTFRNVIQNMEESFRRSPRRITLIYAGAWLHNDVVANGYFKLAKQVYTDTWVRYVNIYTITP